MDKIIYQEAYTTDTRVRIGILMYVGSGDPVRKLNEAVSLYVKNEGYNEFIDANMDNPWIRVIIKGINDMEQQPFNPEIHHL
jgi:archaellum component FlaG (FlaF/FlaG flagellin family)